MKMVSLIDGIFWGVLLIIVGVWFLVRRYVPVHIPVIRVIIAVLFVYLGVRVLVRGPVVQDRNTMIFSDSTALHYTPDRGRDYNVIFSRGDVDLTTVAVSATSIRAEVNVVFGNATLHINPATPAKVKMTSAFGTVDAPGERKAPAGSGAEIAARLSAHSCAARHGGTVGS